MAHHEHRSRLGVASFYLDISARQLDIPVVNRRLGVSATHYYTPIAASPPAFAIAQDTARADDTCCWQYRMRRSQWQLPTSGLERLVARFHRKAVAIRTVCRRYDAHVTIGVVMELHESPLDEPEAMMRPVVVRFAADIGATLSVQTVVGMRPLRSRTGRRGTALLS